MRPSVVLVLLLAACHQSEPVVGKAYLIEATGTRPAPESAITIELGTTPIPAKLSGPVRVAIDRDVPYQTVVADMKKIRAAGGIPAPLVAVRERTEELLPPDEKTGDAINLWADPDGKACVAPPESQTATCINGQATQHIDRAFVRDVMLKAVKEYEMKRVQVIVDPTITWGDAVRAIDGARTCCGDTKIEVSVTPSW
jgi:hypothetical protein